MPEKLNNKKVAILATDGFQPQELLEPKKALEEAGAETVVVSIKDGLIKAWDKDHWSEEVPVDKQVRDCSADDFDALLIPGGTMNPDKLRMDKDAVRFVQDFFRAGKPIGSICHGPWVLIEADIVRGLRATSYEAIKTDMKNAGAQWEDSEVVVDQGVVTSRRPDDIPAFTRKLIEEVAEGRHARPKAGV
jgi:protease I